MQSTMMDGDLTITDILRRGARVYPDSRVVSCEGEGSRTGTFAQVADRAGRLAGALKRLGIQPGDRVGTLSWNHQEHLEAYFAIPCMGAVLHTLNLRLDPEQLAYVINHAEDRIVLVDASLVPMLAAIRPKLTTVERFILVGRGDASALGEGVLDYEELLTGESPDYPWPEIPEKTAAAMCYTTGTTGAPKGVVYSHRSICLHSLAEWGAFSLKEADRALVIVPMFHVNAWGIPYTAYMLGADLLMPGRFLQPEPLCRFIQAEKPTFAAGVPTIWQGVLQWIEAHPADLSSMQTIICGGSAVPRSLMERFEKDHGLRIIQAWGMTETSPIGAVAIPPRGIPAEEEMDWRSKTGRVVAGVQLRIVDDSGTEQPWDGESVGEIEVRGPWITGAYFKDPAPDKFHDGWLRTGDVGCVDNRGFIQITDRSKDVIKSGGEWISSVALETLLIAHPDVLDAAVIAVPDARWDERPLASVVLKPGSSTGPEELRAFIAGQVAKFWVPERWAVVAEIPKTSVGKYDKKVLRAMYADGKLPAVELGAAQRR
ncbi:MAG TPA: long-chain fatty acid--CoA ligase [Candidatus Dormibacteraeota bacterium]|nr:long-chain fatty acid--CoA ligase [Candidatus Dormibacteraeota bacterium]